MPVNNNKPFFSTQRTIKEQSKVIIEKQVADVKQEVVVAEILRQVDKDVISFFDLDYQKVLDMNNIHIISRTGNGNDNNGGTNSTSELIKSLDGKTFDSYEDLLSAIGDNKDIQIVPWSYGNYAVYKVGNDTDGWATVNVRDSSDTNIKYNDDYDFYNQNKYIFPTNGIYSINDLKNNYRLSDEQILYFFNKNGEEYTIKSNLTWNGEKFNDFPELLMKLDEEYDAISASLQEQGFSKEFITYLIQYVKEHTSIDAQEGENFDVSKIIEKYKNEIKNYISKPNLDYQVVIKEGSSSFNPKTGEQKIIPDEYGNLFDQSLYTILSRLNELSSSTDPQIALFVSMIQDSFDKLELNDIEKNTFISNILKNIVNKFGIERIYDHTMMGETSDVTHLNIKISDILNHSNGNETWFDELYDIIFEEASKVKVVDRNPSFIDAGVLLGDKEELTALDIYEGLLDSNNVLSDDGGVRKFYELMRSIRSKVSCYSEFDEIDLIKCVINLINKELGIDSKTITKETIEKLNQQEDLFTKIEEIMNSQEVINLFYFGVDGEIDPFAQGGTGDCWLVASIISISAANPELIKNAITQDSDGTIHVTFAGVGITYDIIPEEMVEAFGLYYSNGDSDVLALELAVEKLFRDIDNGLYSNLGISSSYNAEHKDEISGLLWNNRTYILPYLLTGKKPVTCSKTELSNFVSEFNNGNMIVSLSMSPGAAATTVNGEEFSFGGDNGSNHAFAVVAMTEDTITIVNPWNSTKEYTFTWEEFEKLGCSPDVNFVFDTDEEYVQNILNYVVNDKLSMFNIYDLNNNGLISNYNNEGDSYDGSVITFDYNGQHYKIRENKNASDTIISKEDLDKYFESASLTPEQKQKIIDLCFLPRCIVDGNITYYQMNAGLTIEDIQQIIQVAQSQEVIDNANMLETNIADFLKMCAKSHAGMLAGINILILSDKIQNIKYKNADGNESLSFEYEGVRYALTLKQDKPINTDVILTYNELMQYFENTNLSELDVLSLIDEYFENIGSRSDDNVISVSSTFKIFKGFIYALKDGKTFEEFLNAIQNNT